MHKNVQGCIEWLRMEIAPSWDLETSPAAGTGMALLEPCRPLLGQVGPLWSERHGLVSDFPPPSYPCLGQAMGGGWKVHPLRFRAVMGGLCQLRETSGDRAVSSLGGH